MRVVISAAYDAKLKALQKKALVGKKSVSNGQLWGQITAMRKQAACSDACKLTK